MRSDRAGCLVERRPIASYRWTFHLTRANRWGRAYAGTGGSDGHAEESDPKRGGAFCIPYTGAAHTGRMDSRTSAKPNARKAFPPQALALQRRPDRVAEGPPPLRGLIDQHRQAAPSLTRRTDAVCHARHGGPRGRREVCADGTVPVPAFPGLVPRACDACRALPRRSVTPRTCWTGPAPLV